MAIAAAVVRNQFVQFRQASISCYDTGNARSTAGTALRWLPAYELGREVAMREIDILFAALSRSQFRARQRLSPRDRAYLLEVGLQKVLTQGRRIIGERLAPAEPLNDGRQTPWRGHPVFVAQHATACCCRGCLHKWHQIPLGRPLDESEVNHILAVIERWLTTQAAGASLAGQPTLFDDL